MPTGEPPARRRQRIGAYAVILREGRILLTRLSHGEVADERWTLPGGGVEFGEDPREAAVREVHEETGLDAEVAEHGRVYTVHRTGQRAGEPFEFHALRIVYEGWVPPDSPEPHVVEVGGSTIDARWFPLEDVVSGRVPVVGLVTEALANHLPLRRQRLAVKALVERAGSVLLARLSPSAVETGRWTLPGGGVDHGESPEIALVREVEEETGLRATVGALVSVFDQHFTGTAPDGRLEDFHAVNLIYAATVAETGEPRVVEVDGTTDAVAWVPRTDIVEGVLPVTAVVRFALDLGEEGGPSGH